MTGRFDGALRFFACAGETPVKGIGIGCKGEKHVLSRFALLPVDLPLHLRHVAFIKRDPVAIAMQERVVNFVRDGLLVLGLRVLADGSARYRDRPGW